MWNSISYYKRDLVVAFLGLVALIVFIPYYTYIYFAQDITSRNAILNKNNQGLVLTDRTGKPFFTFYQGRIKTIVPLSDIPPDTQHAVIAIEDKDFYKHPGFSIRGIFRALYVDALKKQLASGGSTITQQLVKNTLLTPRKDFVRKYQEIVLAQELERRYSKNEILEMYLNSVYYGEGAFGIEQAAKSYFGKSAKDLTLSESAMLAGLLSAPSELSPLSGNAEQAKARQVIVLQKMYEQGYITRARENTAIEQKLTYHPIKQDLNSEAPHFALMVRDELIQKYGEQEIVHSGFTVKTTINIAWQEYAERVVKNQVANLARNGVTNGATVVMDPKTGEVLSLVGSTDWYNTDYGKLNVATTPRQPGSAFKPIVYVAGFEKGIITPASPLKDELTTFRNGDVFCKSETCEYKPQNYDRKFRGMVSTRRALANSLNVPSVEVMSRVGVPSAVDMARRLGITTLKDASQYGLSLVLGTGEVKLLDLTDAYSVFANQGVRNTPVTILEIKNRQGKTIENFTPSPERVLAPEYAFLISSILSDNKTRAEVFGNALTISRPAAVKTGTTENYKDAWTVGYTPQLTVGVWVGNNDGTPMDQVAGSLGAAPIWRNLMEHYLAGQPVLSFTPPDNIVSTTFCGFGKNATAAAGLEYFVKGTELQGACTLSPIAKDGENHNQNNPKPTVTPPPTPAQLPSLTPPAPSPQSVQSSGNDQSDHILIPRHKRLIRIGGYNN